MSEAVKASLNIELNVECPECDYWFDLLSYDDGYLNEEGQLMKAACPDGCWSEEHRKFKLEVDCPDCGKSINIQGIAW